MDAPMQEESPSVQASVALIVLKRAFSFWASWPFARRAFSSSTGAAEIAEIVERARRMVLRYCIMV